MFVLIVISLTFADISHFLCVFWKRDSKVFFFFFQEPDSRLWPYVYPSKYPEAQKQLDEERWKEERERERDRDRDRERDRERERDRKNKEERPRPKDPLKDEVKDVVEPRTSAASEEHRGISKDPRAHMQFSSALPQHQSYMPYMHGYPYSQGYDPNHPGYRGMPSVMMQNYPGKILVDCWDMKLHETTNIMNFLFFLKRLAFLIFR